MTIKKTTMYWYRNAAITKNESVVLYPGSKQNGILWTFSEDQRQSYTDKASLKVLNENAIEYIYTDGRTTTLVGEEINQDKLILGRGFKQNYSFVEYLEMILTGKDRGFSKIEWEESHQTGGKER